MDDRVAAALAKWPDVPDVYGWLSLDRRGRWLIRDELVGNPAIREFIGRNYACDARGAWYFQNGPQRVFVHLDYAPWVLRLAAPDRLETHTGLPVDAPDAAWLDDQGQLLISSEHGLGLLSDRDLPVLLDRIQHQSGSTADETQLLALMSGEAPALQLAICARRLSLRAIACDTVPAMGGFLRDPQPD